MKPVKFSVIKSALLVLLLLFAVGCKRWTPEGEIKIRGTATVNGKEYEDVTRRGWNSEFKPSVIYFYPHYKLFYTAVLLQPKSLKKVDAEYVIYFYLTTDNKKQIEINFPYKIGYSKSLDNKDFNMKETIENLVFDKSKIISPDVNNGIAVVESDKIKETHSMEGKFIIHSFDSENKHCKGEYMLKTSTVSGKEGLTIYGKFESEIFESNHHFLNK